MDKRPASIDPRRVNRPLFNASLADRLLSPTGVQLMLLMALIFGCFWPATLLIGLPAAVIILILFSDRPFRMPLRLPTDVREPDLTTERESFKARAQGWRDCSLLLPVRETTSRPRAYSVWVTRGANRWRGNCRPVA